VISDNAKLALKELCPTDEEDCILNVKKHCPDLDEKCLSALGQMDYYLVGRENYNLKNDDSE
jgi:hypothetical protein